MVSSLPQKFKYLTMVSATESMSLRTASCVEEEKAMESAHLCSHKLCNIYNII